MSAARSDGGSKSEAPTTTTPAAVAYAATVALSSRGAQRPRATGPTDPVLGTRPVATDFLWGAWNALRYVFTYVRGRIDAQDRKRNLIDERDGAQRSIEGALFDLGQILLAQPATTPELVALIDAITNAQARRKAAIADLALGEKLQASDDLRLGIEQSNAEAECRTCEARAGELDVLLRDLDQERHRVDEEIERLKNAPPSGDVGARDLEVAALNKKSHLANEQYSTLRERAAALRATTIAARAKFDEATGARRQAAASMTASLSAHARDRTEAEQEIRRLTIQLGKSARSAGLSMPTLTAGYAHLSRLEATVAERDREIASVQQMLGRYDPKKLAIGASILLGIAATCIIGIWAILR